MRSEPPNLTPLEISAIVALVELGGEAYGVPVHERVSALEDRTVSIGALYAALHRLTEKGLVTPRMGDSTDERGGRAKRYFRLTAEGQVTARTVYRRAVSLVNILRPLAGGTS